MNSKPAVASVTIWGIVISAICTSCPQLAAVLHLTDPATQAAIQAFVGGIGTLVGLGVALYGRYHATAPIAGVLKTPTNTGGSAGSGTPPAAANVAVALVVVGLIVLGCGPLIACTTASTATTPAASTVTLDETKALYAAEAAYNGLASAASSAVDAGVLKGAPAAKVSTLLAQAHAALVTARAAYQLGQSNSVTSEAAAVLSIAADVEPLLHPAS